MPRKPKDENDQLAKAVGAEITKAMERLNITVSELHKRTGISRTVLLAYTRGNYAPGARELKLLCEHLDITPNVLLFGSNQVAASPYKLGDLALTHTGAQTIAFLVLLSQLSNSEKMALLTLAEGISAARNPQAHRAVMASIEQALKSPELQQAFEAMADSIMANPAMQDWAQQFEEAPAGTAPG